MARKKKKQIIEPMVKNYYRPTIKPLNLLKLAGLGLLAFFGIETVANGVREIYEEATTENVMVTANYKFFTIVLSNRDTNEAIEVFDDVLEAGLNAEGIENAFDPNLEEKEKKELITNLIKAMAEASHIPVNNVTYVNDLFMEQNGFYIGGKVANVAVGSNSIFINNAIFKESTDENYFPRKLTTVVHEFTHKVENLNIQTNKNVDNLEDKLFAGSTNYDDDDYFATCSELTAYLMANKFMTAMYETYNNDTEYADYGIALTLKPILDEAKSHYASPSKKTVEELLVGAIKYAYKDAGIEISEEELYETYTYEIIKYCVPQEYLDMKYNVFQSVIRKATYSDYNNVEQTASVLYENNGIQFVVKNEEMEDLNKEL